MSDTEAASEEKIFVVDRAKQGRALCKKCKNKCVQGELRIAKLVPSNFGSGKMKAWHHVHCMFELFLKQRQTTKRIESFEDIDGWNSINDDDRELIMEEIKKSNKAFEEKFGVKIPSMKKQELHPQVQKLIANSSHNDDSVSTASDISIKTEINRDNTFRKFRKLVADIASENSYLEKTKIVNKILIKGTDDNGFKGDITLWCRLLLPGDILRTYNLQSKQLIKLFSRIFNTSSEKMMNHLEQGDVSETIEHFFEQNSKLRPAKKSTLTMQEVDDFLEELSKMTKEDDQKNHFRRIAKKCTSHDLKMIIKLIKHDLRMSAGAKHILEGIHKDAYKVFQSSRDINIVINKCLKAGKIAESSNVAATITLFTPILPMLAESCKSVEQAFKKCPNGLFAEIKYDGERVQIHKRGSEFKYFSRSLKPVLPHKVLHVKNYITQAFPHGKDLILDTEILMMDKRTGKPLPFGSLGIHKKSEFKDATVCLFVFDCIYYNGEVLTNKPIKHRKTILKETMTEIKNHIVFSETKEIHKTKDLTVMIADVLKKGLEGLVLKDLNSIYEPGKRHWLKVKKDYLFEGAMADTADLIVLGAWYGTGKKGGMMSVFLMGCYNKETKSFCTVTKVHTGHDDQTLEKLQNQLKMIKISGDPDKVPSWLHCSRVMIPDFVAKNPKQQPVWEITGAEFTQHDVHTADGISIRFPRVTKIRDDKNWETATSLDELKVLYKKSKENTDISLLMKGMDDSKDTNSDVKKKRKSLIISDEESTDSKSDISTSSRKRDIKKIENLSNKKEVKLENDNSNKIISKRKLSMPEFPHDNNKKLKVEIPSEIVESEKIKEPLPNYFTGVKLLLENRVQDIYSEWIRHFVAYGGTVLKSDESMEATHVLHLDDTISEPTIECSKLAKHVIVEWIKDTVSKKNLQNYRPYTVRWKPKCEEIKL